MIKLPVSHLPVSYLVCICPMLLVLPVRSKRDCGTTEYDLRDLNEFGPTNYEDIPSEEFWPTEPRRELNKHYNKHYDEVTDRFTIDYGIHTAAICRCWKSKNFPFCDNSHKLHNRFHQDNVGPLIIDGPTLPDAVLDMYTRPTPDRSLTFSTEPTLSDSAIERDIERSRQRNEYPDSDENCTDRIDKNDFFERLRMYPPGMKSKTAPWGFV